MEISGPKTQTMCMSKEDEALYQSLWKQPGTNHRIYILGFLHGRKQLKQCQHPHKNHQGTKLIWKATEHMEGQGSPSNY